ncbi:hypothetical protein Q7P37_004932 [Cladosporium fusiforme]
MDPALAASLVGGNNNNTPAMNAPAANAPAPTLFPQMPQANTPPNQGGNQLPQPVANYPTPTSTYNSGTPDPFNSWPSTNNNTPYSPGPGPGGWPGMNINNGPNGQHIKMPGLEIFDGPNGESHVKMPGMEIFDGPNGESHIKMPGMDIWDGPNGQHIKMPGMEIFDGPNGQSHVQMPGMNVFNGPGRGNMPGQGVSMRGPLSNRQGRKSRWPFSGNNIQIASSIGPHGNVHGVSYGNNMGYPGYAGPWAEMNDNMPGSMAGMNPWTGGRGNPYKPRRPRGWIRRR